MLKIEISFSDLKEIRKIVRLHSQLAAKQLNDIRSRESHRSVKGWAAKQAEETKALLHLLDKHVHQEERAREEQHQEHLRWLNQQPIPKSPTELENYVEEMFDGGVSVNGEGR